MNIKQFHRSVWGLDKVLFAERTPLPEYRKIVFAERTEELERAEMLLIDTPRNLLVGGLFGVGKTIFLQELMRYLQEQYPEDVLTVYECLDSTEADLLTTILRALARALKAEDEEAARIDQLLSGIEIVEQNVQEKNRGGEGNLSILKIDRHQKETTTSTLTRKLVPNAASQIQELVHRAREINPNRQIIVAIDDLDKRDPATVRQALQEARSTLHGECSFVMTGHPLGILRNIYSTVGAVFDEIITLPILSEPSLKNIMFRYLEAGRAVEATQNGLMPFTEEAAQKIVQRSLGIPRLLNKICRSIMNEATLLRRDTIDSVVLQECWDKAGDNLRRAITADMMRLLEILREKTEFRPSEASDEIYDRLGVDSYQQLMAKFQIAMYDDIVVGMETQGEPSFQPSPLLFPLADNP